MASVEATESGTPAGPTSAAGGANATSPEVSVARADTAESFRSAQSAQSARSTQAEGGVLTGKQEHYLKRELISREVHDEIYELSSPTALQRFGAPFRSPYGEVSPVDSELPILRYIFVNHVRNFPFLDQAKEKEFWQDKLQVFLESFASKYISSSEDRLEETKRRKLSKKCEKLVELMMVSGVPTASGYEERIRFEEMEVVDRGANEQGLVVNQPDGHFINGWDINVAGVHMVSVKRTVRYHQHAEFLIRVRRPNKDEYYIGRRYGDFVRLQKRLRLEMPGKVLIPLPKKNMSHSISVFGVGGGGDDDESSISSLSTVDRSRSVDGRRGLLQPGVSGRLNPNGSLSSSSSPGGRKSPQPSLGSERDRSPHAVRLHREDQRVSLRAFLRTILQNQQVAESKAMADFLTDRPIELNEEEREDVQRRREMDERRLEEQRQFYEIARKRAAELDIYMERFRREIVERNGLTKLFAEIKQKSTIEELSPKYQKFAEWLRIEVAATLYHLFLAEDNSPELFAQFKRIHSLIPYTILKNVIRVANPAAVMAGVLDLFLAQPFGARSLLQRIFSQAIHDGMRQIQRAIDDLTAKINDPVLTDKLKAFVDCPEESKNVIRAEAADEQVDVVVAILRSEHLSPELTPQQTERVFNAYAAWNAAVDSPDAELRQGAEMFSQLKQQLKLLTRFRDKAMMAQMIEEPNTLRLFRDLFTIFYEPLVRVYKSANVYGSITDFALFATDAIKTIEIAQRQDVSADPNQTVQSFIDLCARHEQNLYKFIHEVHLHDNGLFGALMSWIEGILDFLRTGPKAGKLDMNAIFQGGLDQGIIDAEVSRAEINDLIRWQEARKKWHSDKTRQKMAQDDSGPDQLPGANTFKSGDFGLDQSAGDGERHRTDSEPVQANRLNLRSPRS
ncbi:hypothetical protein DV736_g1774, partial [Chaetothyriales sp. CBS 134916]